MSEKAITFVTSMVAHFPGLKALLEEHVKDNLGEMLPHVFFGEVTRYMLSLVLAASSGGLLPRNELRDILHYLEEAYATGDDELRELITVSILENLPRPGDAGAEIREMIGPNLTRQLRVIGY